MIPIGGDVAFVTLENRRRKARQRSMFRWWREEEEETRQKCWLDLHFCTAS